MTYLVDHPADFRGAFARLRREIRMLYFSAYQSHLWNLLLAGWLEANAGPGELVLVDLKVGTFPFPRRMPPERVGGLSRASLPLPCARTPLPEGPLGAIVEKVLAPSGLAWNDLRIKHQKDIFFSKGSRPCLFFPSELRFGREDDALHPGRQRPAPRLRAAEGVIRHDPRQADHRCRGGRVMSLEVLYEDNHCLAVNKPAGLPSQGDDSGAETLVDRARQYLKERYGKPGNVYVGLVHRLDRPTSGVVLLARTSKAAGRLAAQFREGSVGKVYWAIVEGSPIEDEGTWIDRIEKDRGANRSRDWSPLRTRAARRRVSPSACSRAGRIWPGWSCGHRPDGVISSGCSWQAGGCRSWAMGNMGRGAGSWRRMAGIGSRCMPGS